MISPAYVISTRIRIARNLHSYPFPPNASERERQEVLECVRQALRRNHSFQDGSTLFLDQLDPLERKILEEEHVISHLSATQGSARAVMMTRDGSSSILVNEEDHLRIQAFSPGLALRNTWRAANSVEKYLRDALQFAYSEQEGFLTSCPQNSGTGIRISTMLFLPGLMILQGITSIVQACLQDAYTVRGAYGEGSQAQGYLLQLSLHVPHLQKIMRSLEQYRRRCRSIIQQEHMARTALLTSSSPLLRKRMRWAKQQLKHSRSFSLASGLHVLAISRLGICLGFKPPTFRKVAIPNSIRIRYLQGIDRLWRQIQAAHIRRTQLQYLNGDSPNVRDRNENDIRASLLLEGLEAVMKS